MMLVVGMMLVMILKSVCLMMVMSVLGVIEGVCGSGVVGLCVVVVYEWLLGVKLMFVVYLKMLLV